MELAEHYLDEVQKVGGVYVLHVDRKISPDEVTGILKSWESILPGERLIILPNELIISKVRKYSFYMAMMLVRQGVPITRLRWVEKHMGYEEAPYFTFDEENDILMLRTPGTEDKDEYFFVGRDDMDHEDYVLHKGVYS